jgi:hypothetical protein
VAFKNYFKDFSELVEKGKNIDATRDNGWNHQQVRVRAFYSNVYSARQADPRGMWRLDVFSSRQTADVRLMFTEEQRRQLIEALGGTVEEWTQADEDAHIARKHERDWHRALKPEDV